MLTTVLRSTDVDLTTTGALRARVFGATSTSTVDDALLGAAIRAASRWAEGVVGYPLTLQGYAETVPSFGTRRLLLSRTPLRSVAVFESSDADAEQLTSTQFRADTEAGILTREDGWPWTAPLELELEERPVPGEEAEPWYVEYAAGYTYNGVSTDSALYSTSLSTDTGRTLPEDIEEAVLVKASDLYGYAVNGGEVQEERLGDLQVNYRSGGADRPGGAPSAAGLADLLLEPYRRVV